MAPLFLCALSFSLPRTRKDERKSSVRLEKEVRRSEGKDRKVIRPPAQEMTEKRRKRKESRAGLSRFFSFLEFSVIYWIRNNFPILCHVNISFLSLLAHPLRWFFCLFFETNAVCCRRLREREILPWRA